MPIEFWIPFGLFLVTAIAAMYFSIEASLNRNQVRLLQAQRRTDRKAHEGGYPAPQIQGLWADLDEKERLRSRVAELEADQRGEDGS